MHPFVYSWNSTTPFTSRPIWGPACGAHRCSDLPTVFMGSGQGFDHKALAIVETVGKVLVSAGFEVLGSLGGVCCRSCQEKHREMLSAMPSDTIGSSHWTGSVHWVFLIGMDLRALGRQDGPTQHCTEKNATFYRLNVCVSTEFIFWNLTHNVTELIGGGGFGRWPSY